MWDWLYAVITYDQIILTVATESCNITMHPSMNHEHFKRVCLFNSQPLRLIKQ